MPTLPNYHHFAGSHWESGTLHNVYAYLGVKAPHTGEPYSEALLLGVSGGIVMGYFSFAYEGFDPQCNILTRNTFDPFETMMARLGIVQTVQQTAKADKAVDLLVDALADGSPAIVWADHWSLPYNGLGEDEQMWGMMPIVVYGYDVDADCVCIADRARVPLTVSTAQLAAARGRIKKDKHRLLTVDVPDPDKLASAVNAGIWDCIKLFTEKPPKGSADNFGLRAYENWAKLLAKPKQRLSWEKIFAPGPKMYAGLTSAYNFAFLFGKDEALDAERSLYADFLDEAAVILDKPALRDAATSFRRAAQAWRSLGTTLLPDEIEPLGEARSLMTRRHLRFLQAGEDALDEMRRIDAQLAELRRRMETEFPLTQAEAEAHREGIAEQLITIRAIEAEGVAAMRSV
ncbi:DUF4872 domain-containing protein [bacterium]|nr:DUF4872 domain-containing protein [bacterium]